MNKYLLVVILFVLLSFGCESRASSTKLTTEARKNSSIRNPKIIGGQMHMLHEDRVHNFKILAVPTAVP